MRSPHNDMRQFMRTVRLANRLRPLLARIRRRRDLNQAQQLRRTGTTPPSPIAETSEQFLGHEPRDISLFDWSDTRAVTPDHGRLLLEEYFSSEERTVPKQFALSDAAPQIKSPEKKTPPQSRGAIRKWFYNLRPLSRAQNSLLFFMLGVLAPTVVSWMTRGSASPFSFSQSAS